MKGQIQKINKTIGTCRLIYNFYLAHNKELLENAEENLQIAQSAFKEGVLSPDKVMEAQTAWLKARSENIDAEIDLRLCEVYLSKVTGQLNIQSSNQ